MEHRTARAPSRHQLDRASEIDDRYGVKAPVLAAIFLVCAPLFLQASSEPATPKPETKPSELASKEPPSQPVPVVVYYWFDLLENNNDHCIIRLLNGPRIEVFIRDAPKTLYTDQNDLTGQEALLKLDKLRLEQWKSRLDHTRRKSYAQMALYKSQMAQLQAQTSQLNEEKHKNTVPYHHVSHHQGYCVGKADDLPEWRIVR
jgi:hypothetical protein